MIFNFDTSGINYLEEVISADIEFFDSLPGAASRNYSKGEYLIYGTPSEFYLFIAIDDIPAGTYFSGSNLKSVRIASKLNSHDGIITDNIETSNTASKNYEVNDFLVQGDTLKTVITPISSGATFTGSNITTTTVGDQLKALTKRRYASYGGATFRVYRIGFVVFFTCVVGVWRNVSGTDEIEYSLNSGTTWNSFQLADEYRPASSVEIMEANFGKRITVTTDGKFHAILSGNSALRFSSTWISKDIL